jgi:flagellar assembly factor FliW
MTTMAEAPAPQGRQLHFIQPLPGFDDIDAFTLAAIDARGLLYAMRAVVDPSLRFILAPPEGFFADYRPEIADEVGDALGAGEVEVLVIVSVPSGLHDATANLRAPIVISPATGRAMQIILEDESLPMRRPLIAA